MLGIVWGWISAAIGAITLVLLGAYGTASGTWVDEHGITGAPTVGGLLLAAALAVVLLGGGVIVAIAETVRRRDARLSRAAAGSSAAAPPA